MPNRAHGEQVDDVVPGVVLIARCSVLFPRRAVVVVIVRSTSPVRSVRVVSAGGAGQHLELMAQRDVRGHPDGVGHERQSQSNEDSNLRG